MGHDSLKQVNLRIWPTRNIKMKRFDDLLNDYIAKELSPRSNFKEIYEATRMKIRKAALNKGKKRLAPKSNS